MIEIDALKVFITLGTTLGSLVPFRTRLGGLFTFYLGESYHHFLLVCAFSPALTCVFLLALLYTKNTFQVVEEPPALEAGPQPGAGPGARSAL